MADTTQRPRRRRRRALAAWWNSVRWFAIALGAAGAFVLGVIGFQQRFALIGESRSFLDSVYLSVQLFTLESGSASPPVPAALQIARFLAPAAGVVGGVAAVMALFGEQISRVRLRFAKRHAVVCGLGERGVRIAEDMLREGLRVVVVERDEGEPHVRRAREAGATVVIGDAAEIGALRTVRADRARYVVAVCPDDGTNAEIVTRLSELLVDSPPKSPVTAFVHVEDTELCDLLTERGLFSSACDGLRLEFFNVPKSGARAMLAAVPPVSRSDGAAPHVVVVGLGKLGRSLTLQMAHDWWDRRDRMQVRPRVSLVDRAAAEKADVLRTRAARLDEACEVVPVPMEKNAAAFERAEFLYTDGRLDVDAVYICPDDDVHALANALTIERHTCSHHVPIAVRMSGRGGLAVLLAGQGIDEAGEVHAVGVLDATCTLAALLGGAHESIAVAVHEDYVRRQAEAGYTTADNPSMVPWEHLPENLKESNRRQADHIGEKLRAVGLSIVPKDDWAAETEQFSDAEVERLAEIEHERWMQERSSQGWRYAAGEKDLDRRTSPHLVPWATLAEEVRDLDRDAVRAIPGLLARAGLGLRRTSC